MGGFEYFTFRDSRVRWGLLGVGAVALGAAWLFPPSSWISGVGLALVAVGVLSHSARTGQWFKWRNWKPQFSWFEGWAAATGAILALVQVIVMAVSKGP